MVLLTALVFATAFLAAVGVPASAQNDTAQGGDATNATQDAGGNATQDAGNATGEGGAADDAETGGVPRKYTVRALDDGCPAGAEAPCWDLELLPVLPGDQVVVTVDLTPSAQPHNFHVVDPIGQMTATEVGVVQELTFQIPEDFGLEESIEFICDVHPTTMVGRFAGPGALGAGEEEAIPEMGVHFLAYWVGLIAFALLFIVYGATFFLFKYNETNATTDQWDRSDAPKGRWSSGVASLLAIVIAVAALAGIIYVATLG